MRNCSLYIVKFFTGLDILISCFWPIFADFQNEAAGLCVNNSIDKDVNGLLWYHNLMESLRLRGGWKIPGFPRTMSGGVIPGSQFNSWNAPGTIHFTEKITRGNCQWPRTFSSPGLITDKRHLIIIFLMALKRNPSDRNLGGRVWEKDAL